MQMLGKIQWRTVEGLFNRIRFTLRESGYDPDSCECALRKNAEWRFFTSRGAHVNCAIMVMLYTFIWWCLKCVIVYLAQDIPTFVMNCIYGGSGSSLLIESTDSMILLILLQ